jgi:hypothetical protein
MTHLPGLRAIRALFVATLPCIGLPALAATTPTTQAVPEATVVQPVPALQELDEVWVYGKSLARRIARAEDEFLYRYNQLNRKDDYRITCGHFTLDRGSMVMRRNCTPEFMRPAPGALLTRLGPDGCTRGSAIQTAFGSDGFATGNCTVVAIARSRVSRLPPISSSGIPAATTEQRKAYATNITKLMIGDDQLRAKGESLAVLYREFDEARQQYTSLREATPPKPKGHPRF